MRVSIKASSRSNELRQMLSAEHDIIVGDSVDTAPWSEEAADITIWQPDEDVDWESADEQGEAGEMIVLADAPTDEWIASALKAGVKAILPTEISAEGLIAAVRAVAAGLVVFPGSGRSVLARNLPVQTRSLVEPLTPRELEILSAMAEGLTNKEAAARFQISEHTVKFHVASILSKLGAASRTEAVTLAIRQGLIMI